MGLFSGVAKPYRFLFVDKGDDPAPQFHDEVLGPMTWSEDDEAWGGEYRGVSYLLAYDNKATPKSELVAFARDILTDPEWLAKALLRARSSSTAEMPELADEIAALRLEVVHFTVGKSTRSFFASLAGGKRDRCWRIEFSEFLGMGFDT